jgi:class 3 adenylate cyclase
VTVLEAPVRGSTDNRAEHGRRPRRLVASLLFTDIVGSVAHAWHVGDRAWCELLQRHDELVRDELERWMGREIDTAGDGFFAAFDRPADAIECACRISRKVTALDVQVRAGVHAAEVASVGRRLVGIGVLIGARLTDHARGGEILVSGTVKDLLAGSGVRFRERGLHELRGIPGSWPLYAVECEQAAPSSRAGDPHAG